MIQVFAQTLTLPGGGGTIKGPVEISTIGQLIGKAIPMILTLAGFGLLLMIIAAGFTLLTSAGDPKKMESGKQRLTYAIAGFLIIFSAYWIVQIVGKIFGFQEIQQGFGG